MADEDVINEGDSSKDSSSKDDAFLNVFGEDDLSPEILKDIVEDKGDKGEEDDTKSKVVDDDKGQQVLDERLKEYEGRLDKLETDKKNLQKALHEERQSKKKEKQSVPGETLSDADLAKIIEEHKDDPVVLLNAVAYKAEQIMKKGKSEAVDEVLIKQRSTYLDNLLRSKFGDALDDDGSEIRAGINKAKEYFNVTDHPYGDAIGAAAVVFDQLPKLLQFQYEKGQKDAIDGKVEKSRVADIKNGNSLLSGNKRPINTETKDKKTGLTETEYETATKTLGFKPGTPKFNIYVEQIKKRRAA